MEEKLDWWRGHIIGVKDRNGIMIREGFLLEDVKNNRQYQVIWDQRFVSFFAASRDWLEGKDYKHADMVSFPSYRMSELRIIGIAKERLGE